MPQPLSGAFSAPAANRRSSLVAADGFSANGADVWKFVWFSTLRPFFRHYAKYFGYYLPGLSYNDGVANADILIAYKVLVMQGGVSYGSSRKAHRLNDGFRGKNARSSHLDNNIRNLSHFLFWRIFKGDSPARRLCGAPEREPVRKAVNLDYGSVDIVIKFLSVLSNICNSILDPVKISIFPVRNGAEAKLFKKLKAFRVSFKAHFARSLHVEYHDVKPALSGNFRIKLAQRSGCGVPRIGKQRLFLRFSFRVELTENLFGHIYLAANDKVCRRALKLQGKAPDRS